MSVLAVPSGLLITVLRALPRDAILRLRLACRAMCARVSDLLACRDVGFRRTLRVHGFSWDVPRTVRSLLARFGPAVRAWEIRVDAARFLALASALEPEEPEDAQAFQSSFRVALAYTSGGTYPMRELAANASDASAFRCLTRLDFASDGRALDDVERLVRAIARIGGMRHLTSLDIGNCFDTGPALVGALGAGLTSLRLASTGLTAETWASIAASLSPALTDLNLSCNPIGSHALAASLAPFTRLVSLDLQYINSGKARGGVGPVALADVLRTLTQLTRLDLSDNRIDLTALRLTGLTALTHLGLAYARLDARTLVPTLPATLTRLRLDGVELGAAGATALAHALRTMPRMRHLDLRATGIDDDGADALIIASWEMPDLWSLELAGNNLSFM